MYSVEKTAPVPSEGKEEVGPLKKLNLKINCRWFPDPVLWYTVSLLGGVGVAKFFKGKIDN